MMNQPQNQMRSPLGPEQAMPQQQGPQGGMPDLSQLPPEILMQLLQLLTSEGGGGLPGLEAEEEGLEGLM